MKKAFTLIELLTVVGIIAILMGILIPVIGSARTSAMKTDTRLFYSQIANALEQYRMEYGFWPFMNHDNFKVTDNGDVLSVFKVSELDMIGFLQGYDRTYNHRGKNLMTVSSQYRNEDNEIMDPFLNKEFGIVISSKGLINPNTVALIDMKFQDTDITTYYYPDKEIESHIFIFGPSEQTSSGFNWITYPKLD